MARPLALVLLLVGLAGCSEGEGGAGEVLLAHPLELPMGSTWAFSYVDDRGEVQGTSQHDVVAYEERHGHRTVQVRARGASAEGDAASELLQWLRVPDGAFVASSWSMTDTSRSDHSSRIAVMPCALPRYPIIAGDAYDVTCRFTTTFNSGTPYNETQQRSVQVIGRDETTVPAGTFATIHVRVVDEQGNPQDMHFASDGCGLVRVDATQGTRSTHQVLTASACR